MQFVIEGPSSLDALAIQVEGNGIKVSPVAIRGQHIMKAAYVTAKGAGGNETKAIILFNATTGQFNLQNLGGEQHQFDFDKTPAEFKTKREQQKSIKVNKRVKSTTPPPAEGAAPTDAK